MPEFSVEFGGVANWEGEAEDKDEALKFAIQTWVAEISAFTLSNVSIYDEDGDEV